MYLLPFRNKYRNHDFKLISDTIVEYYSLTKGKRHTHQTFESTPGFKKIGRLMESEFLNQKMYREKWGKLTSHLKKVLKKPVHAYPDLSGGGFFAEVVISEVKQPDFIRKKSLHFYISVLGPFFSIQGVDSSNAILSIDSASGKIDTGNFTATHAITVSPVFEYAEVFNALEDELRVYFPGYLFVPYEIGMSTIKNISIADELRDPRSMDTIYEGLFGRLTLHDCPTRGDEAYGFNDWIRPLNKGENSLLDLMSEHIIQAPTGITVHKVWKLQESKRLDTFKISGNVMFGMDLFDVIDLTDKSTAIVTSKEQRAPSKGKYKIKDNVIEMSSNYSLRITALSNETLTLNLILNLEHEKVSIKGEAMEMKFVQMKKLVRAD